jgi:hypothetical protein
MSGEQCSWCGVAMVADDGFRLGEQAGERRAAFCRLEHVVPWAIQGAHWDPGTIAMPSDDAGLERCAECAAELDDGRIVLVRHRGEHLVADAFCGMPHVLAWSRAGGRWR